MSGEGEQRSACLSGEEDKYVLVRVKRRTKKCLFEWRKRHGTVEKGSG